MIKAVLWITISLLLFFFSWLIDYGFGEDQQVNAVVSSKYYRSAYITTTWISHGKSGGHMSVIHHPETWNVKLKYDEELFVRQYGHSAYDRIRVGDRASLTITTGCFTGMRY